MTTETARQQPRFLRLPAVMERTGLGRDAVYKLERRGEFPHRRRISARASGWIESEVAAWIESRPLADPKYAPIDSQARTKGRAAVSTAS